MPGEIHSHTHTLDEYLDAARALLHLSSDRRLAKAIGVTPATVNAWRAKRQWPSDEAMIAIADMMGMSRELALADLSRWRAKTPEAAATYGNLIDAFVDNVRGKYSEDELKSLSQSGKRIFLPFVFALFAFFSIAPAHATPNLGHDVAYSVYYGDGSAV